MEMQEWEWEDIYNNWGFVCGNLNAPKMDRDLFKPITLQSGRYLPPGTIVDWWGNDEIETRITQLGKPPVVNWYETTPAGIIRTAQMLWKYKEDAEKIALVWVAASLWEFDKRFLGNWGESGCAKLIQGILDIVLETMRKKKMWYWHGSTKRTLPKNLAMIYKAPEDEYELLKMIAVNSIMSLSLNSLIKIDVVDV